MTVIDTTTVIALLAFVGVAVLAGLVAIAVPFVKSYWASRPATTAPSATAAFPAYWGYIAY